MPVHFSIYSVHINRSKDPRTQFATANHEESDRNVWSIRIKKKKKKTDEGLFKLVILYYV